MKKLVFLSLLSVALLTSCGNGAQKDALKAQNDSLMVELSNRNAELDDIMGAFNEVQEGFRQINEAENRVDLQSGSIRENSADKIKEDIRFISEKLQSNREQIAKLEKQLKNSQTSSVRTCLSSCPCPPATSPVRPASCHTPRRSPGRPSPGHAASPRVSACLSLPGISSCRRSAVRPMRRSLCIREKESR